MLRAIVKRSFINYRSSSLLRYASSSSSPPLPPKSSANEEHLHVSRTAGMPEFIEHWAGTKPFKITCGIMTATTVGLFFLHDIQIAAVAGLFTSAFAYRGYLDVTQRTHTLTRNFPVLGHVRYMLESIRPEIRFANEKSLEENIFRITNFYFEPKTIFC